MITGLGIDIVSISRIAEKIAKDTGFKEAVFTKKEISYCEATTVRNQHYAARFAVKEAFLKATGKGLGYAVDSLRNIEVDHDNEGKPFIRLKRSFKEMAKIGSWQAIHVSITHEGDNASAIVIIEK